MAQGPIYQNVNVTLKEKSTYHVVSKDDKEMVNEYTGLNEQKGYSNTPISKVGRLQKSLAHQIHYTDVLLDSPDVPSSNEIPEDLNGGEDNAGDTTRIKKKPLPPVKPKHIQHLPTPEEDDYTNMNYQIPEQHSTKTGVVARQSNRKCDRKNAVIVVLSGFVFVAIAIAMVALTFAVINFGRFKCQTKSNQCTINYHNNSCEVWIDHPSHTAGVSLIEFWGTNWFTSETYFLGI